MGHSEMWFVYQSISRMRMGTEHNDHNLQCRAVWKGYAWVCSANVATVDTDGELTKYFEENTIQHWSGMTGGCMTLS
jgi:hypothetical protein